MALQERYPAEPFFPEKTLRMKPFLAPKCKNVLTAEWGHPLPHPPPLGRFAASTPNYSDLPRLFLASGYGTADIKEFQRLFSKLTDNKYGRLEI